ncbi:MAG: ATP-binding protein [Sulfurovum sp.]
MLKQMILINSAEFDYAQIDLEKDLFFAGDNGTGKTSSIIALFYLFSGDNNSRKLGISSDKKSFKEYYFPENKNSYIIYVFDDFFIFMYKNSGEVFKFFSKQVFDINSIVFDDGKLREFKDIQEYIKEPEMTYLSKAKDDYRSIIYGQNSKYIDFKLTAIKHYDIFIELFNQTFNVDKSIVDATSIKRAIQKSLNHSDAVIEFSYQKYMEQIKKFQDTYIFFSRFEKESEKIDSAFMLKERAIENEKNILSLEASIRYRDSIEQGLLQQSQTNKALLEQTEQNFEQEEQRLYNLLHRCEGISVRKRAKLTTDIKKIEKLQAKYSPKELNRQHSLLHKEPQLHRENRESQEQLTLLKADVSSVVESVEREINALKYKRDTELNNESRAKKTQLQQTYQEDMDREKEKLRQAKESFEHNIETQKQSIQHHIEENQKAKDNENFKVSKIHQEYLQKLNSFKDERDKNRREFIQQKEAIFDEQREKKRAIKLLDEKKEDTKDKYNRDKKHIAELLIEERTYLNSELQKQRAILFTPQGSFKEFLQQSGVSWENELYPFMDSSLLTIPSSKLNPKINNEHNLLGIDMDMKSLKRIPTQEEAEDSIHKLLSDKKEYFRLYREKKNTIKRVYQDDLRQIEEEYSLLEYAIKKAQSDIVSFDEKIRDIRVVQIPKKEQELKKQEEEELIASKKSITEIEEQIKSLRTDISNLQRSQNEFYKSQKSEIQLYANTTLNKLQKETSLISNWLKDEAESINKNIKAKETSKELVTKDEKIVSLEKRLREISPLLAEIERAKKYIEEYEIDMEFIETLEAKKSRLNILNQSKIRYKTDINYKQKEQEEKKAKNKLQMIEREKEIFTLQDGIQNSQKLNISKGTQTKETQTHLVELIKLYQSAKREYREDIVTLRETLSKLNEFKTNPFMPISFSLSTFNSMEQFSQDIDTIEKIDELKAFKDKKFEPLKRTSNEEYKNFIKNEIPLKLETLSHAEDKFQEQVKQINKNLSTIDFTIIKDIKIATEIGNKRSIMKLLGEIKDLINSFDFNDTRANLFFNRTQTNQDLQKIALLLKEIKDTLNGGAITLLDTIDLALEFTENGKRKTAVTQIKNESSTGGTILLKMAIAVSILGLYTNEKDSTFFLILDEVSRLHSHNQDVLREFANSRGFKIVFVTPEPIYAKPDEIRYYKFQRREDHRFEVISLNHTME